MVKKKDLPKGPKKTSPDKCPNGHTCNKDGFCLGPECPWNIHRNR